MLIFCGILLTVSAVSCFSGCYDSDNVLPVPASSLGHITPGSEFYVEKFTSEPGSDGVYFATNGGYTMFFIVGLNEEEGVAVFDAPPSGSWVKHAIENITSFSVKKFIYGHYHTDHVGDAKDFMSTATYIAQEKTTAFLASRVRDLGSSVALPVPSISWCDYYTFTHGNYTVEMQFNEESAGHVPGNAFIWVPQVKLLMIVDIVFPGWVPFNRYVYFISSFSVCFHLLLHRMGESENATALVANVNEILKYPFEKFIGGHVGRWGTRSDILDHESFLNDLLDIAAETGSLSPDSFAPYYTQQGNLFNFLRSWYETMACNCRQKLIEKWGTKLAAVDIYSESHCYLIQEAMRIDANPATLVYPSPFGNYCENSVLALNFNILLIWSGILCSLLV
jgi:glyoxylase-like metal-dependent hydrolase (beta-lactamase superfamily II)